MTIKNYFKQSEGTWKFIKQFSRGDIINASKYGIGLRSKRDLTELLAKTIDVPREELRIQYTYYNSWYGKASIYYYHEKTNTIYRLSDHWSNSNHKAITRATLSNDRYWNLRVFKKDFKDIKRFNNIRCRYSNYWLGKIKLNNLKKVIKVED